MRRICLSSFVHLFAGSALLVAAIAAIAATAATTPVEQKRVPVRRIAWPAEAHSLEMFSAMSGGPDGRVYAGTCNAVKIGARLIALDPD
jgi:hypothetical protein